MNTIKQNYHYKSIISSNGANEFETFEHHTFWSMMNTINRTVRNGIEINDDTLLEYTYDDKPEMNISKTVKEVMEYWEDKNYSTAQFPKCIYISGSANE
jgi:hypothetical protein